MELYQSRGAQVRSRIKFIEEGEKCNKYFLSLEKVRSSINTIKFLRDTEGNKILNETDIVETIGTHFEKIYNKNNTDVRMVSALLDDFTNDIILPRLDEDEMMLFEEDISEEEVATALKGMNKNSSPGNDGIPIEFYLMFWQHVRTPLLECFDFSKHCGVLPLSERVGIITLVHKGKELTPNDLDNWRPISLCNSDYKILAKVPSDRLETVIDKLVGHQQTGFLKGRHILHRSN